MWLWLLLVLITALPSGDTFRADPVVLRSRTFHTGCVCLTMLIMRFSLELKQPLDSFWRGLISLFHLAPVSRAIANPKRTVLKGPATYWSFSSCSQRPPWSCVLAWIQWHLRYLHLVQAKDLFFFFFFPTLHKFADKWELQLFLSRISVQKKTSPFLK